MRPSPTGDGYARSAVSKRLGQAEQRTDLEKLRTVLVSRVWRNAPGRPKNIQEIEECEAMRKQDLDRQNFF